MTSLDRPPDTSDASDGDLIAAAKAGDAEAFAALYERYADQVYRHILYRTGSRADSEDLTQQTLIRAWRAIGRYQVTNVPFVAWLMTISQNLIATWAKRRRQHEPLELDPPFLDAEPEPSEMAERAFTAEVVRRAVAKLPGEQQQVVVMRYLNGLDFAVIARALGKTENNVRVISHRALKRLQHQLEDSQ